MQFSCESCKTQLQIADEKVRGKRLIVRCKRCGAKISISDPALGAARPRMVAGPPASAPPAASAKPASSAISAPPAVSAPARPARSSPAASAERDSDTDSTRAMDSDLLEQALQASKVEEPVPRRAGSSAAKPLASAPSVAVPADAPLWFAMLHGKQIGPLTRAELGARTDEGTIGPRTYLWKDGMSAWQRAKDLPELEGIFPLLPGAPLPPAAAPPVAALRELSSPDFVGKAQPVEPPKAQKPPKPGKLEKPLAAPALAKDGATAVDQLPPGQRVAGAGRDLFTPPNQGRAQKPGDLARWAAAELEKKPAPPRPSASAAPRPSSAPAPRMFEGTAQQRSRGPFVLVVLGVMAAAAVVLWLVLETGPRGGPPAPKEARAEGAPATPATPVPSKETRPPAKPEPKPEVPAATGLTADQVRRKLDENKGALQGCIDEALRRDPNLRVGKIHIATTISPTGAVTQAKVDKSTVDQSPLGACLRRATKKIAFPSFSGDAFDVDIPIVVTAGE